MTYALSVFNKPCDFVAGAHNTSQIPDFNLPEFAFVGRSNVGKSSLLNALLSRKSLARVSHTPGRTQQLNFFKLGDQLILADLPGYGFAAVSKKKSDAWQRTIFTYLRARTTLKRVFLLIDGRHGIKKSDEEVMDLLDEAAVSYVIILTKADKVGAKDMEAGVAEIMKKIPKHTACYPKIYVSSAHDKKGMDDIHQHVVDLLNGEMGDDQ